MPVTIETNGDTMVARLSGELDHHHTQKLREEIDRNVQKERPARLELLRQSPPVLLDGAHNPNGGRALCNAVKSLDLHDLTAVVGMLRDKDCLPVLRMMAPYCARMIVTTVPNPRSYPAEEFAELARGVCRDITICPDCEEAARLALATAGEHGVLVFGSLYLASAVRPVMLEALKKN